MEKEKECCNKNCNKQDKSIISILIREDKCKDICETCADVKYDTIYQCCRCEIFIGEDLMRYLNNIRPHICDICSLELCFNCYDKRICKKCLDDSYILCKSCELIIIPADKNYLLINDECIVCKDDLWSDEELPNYSSIYGENEEIKKN